MRLAENRRRNEYNLMQSSCILRIYKFCLNEMRPDLLPLTCRKSLDFSQIPRCYSNIAPINVVLVSII